ncbi:PIN domain-containing protein [Methylobacterium sp. BTF04]|uniref:PIN domain-containing protein n=1 Tax=Methylobacterium sp. BTF04 TaxID=2708300 RepID=UPI0013D0D523|nr:PIN domain-containing protein [Methylobacterium sp. BTF04]NEU10885.1 PIN domain-containing protein [Methylobacterium sp. BTF04]
MDTDVFIDARDDRFPEKQTVARCVGVLRPDRGESADSGRASRLDCVRGRLPVDPEEARRTTLASEKWSEGTTDLDLLGDAWAVRARTRFPWWDCVILATAIRTGYRFLLSEDDRHGREVEGTTIVNPFRASPDTIFANS